MFCGWCATESDEDDEDDEDGGERTWREVKPNSLEQSGSVAEILRGVVILVRVKLNLHHVTQWRHALRPLQDGAAVTVPTICK